MHAHMYMHACLLHHYAHGFVHIFAACIVKFSGDLASSVNFKLHNLLNYLAIDTFSFTRSCVWWVE